MGWPGMLWSSRSHPRCLIQGSEVMLSCPYRHCLITSSTAGTQFGKASLISTAQHPRLKIHVVQKHITKTNQQSHGE